MEFEAFPKMQRVEKMSTRFVITEKLDGSNAQIAFDEEGKMFVGSRNRWLTPGKNSDNYAFAAWCEEHADELRALGAGRHYGEWYGDGIGQRGKLYADAIRAREGLEYDPSKPLRRLALFNTLRWMHSEAQPLPACCELIAVLCEGQGHPEGVMRDAECVLRTLGSRHVPGMMDPEGFVIYLPGQRVGFKRVFEGVKAHPSPIEHPEAT